MVKIHIGSITDRGLDLDETVDATQLPLLHALSREGKLRFSHPVYVHLHATLAGETVFIDGTAATVVHLPCSRCLEAFDMPVETDFSATAAPQMPSMTDADAADDIELAEDQMNVMVYNGNRIDMGDEIAQQVIMAIPFKPLCHEKCKGLCSRCGADLNKIPCKCQAEDKANPFAVLNTLSFSKEKD